MHTSYNIVNLLKGPNPITGALSLSWHMDTHNYLDYKNWYKQIEKSSIYIHIYTE